MEGSCHVKRMNVGNRWETSQRDVGSVDVHLFFFCKVGESSVFKASGIED